MAIIPWTDFVNGETGLNIRGWLNGALSAIRDWVEVADADITSNKSRLTTAEADIVSLQSPQASFKFAPQVTSPTYAEGQAYYDDNTGILKLQGPFTGGYELKIGHEIHVHCQNNSGATIPKGTVVRTPGASGGLPLIVPALADTYENALVFGVVAWDIPNNTSGPVTVIGSVDKLDTSGYTAGVPLYLSDTVAGALTPTPPAIASQVGGVTVSDVSVGEFIVSIINHKQLPASLAALQGQSSGTWTYVLSGTAVDINDFTSKIEKVATADLTTGIITAAVSGLHRIHVDLSYTFTTLSSTRDMSIEVYDVTATSVVHSHAINIPRDATLDSNSSSVPFIATAGHQYKLRATSVSGITIDITDISFDLESLGVSV